VGHAEVDLSGPGIYKYTVKDRVNQGRAFGRLDATTFKLGFGRQSVCTSRHFREER